MVASKAGRLSRAALTFIVTIALSYKISSLSYEGECFGDRGSVTGLAEVGVLVVHDEAEALVEGDGARIVTRDL